MIWRVLREVVPASENDPVGWGATAKFTVVLGLDSKSVAGDLADTVSMGCGRRNRPLLVLESASPQPIST